MKLKKVGVIEETKVVSFEEALKIMERGYPAACLHLGKDYIPDTFGDIDYSETTLQDGEFVNRYGYMTFTTNEEAVKKMKESQWRVALKRPTYVIEANDLTDIEIEEVPSHKLLRNQ